MSQYFAYNGMDLANSVFVIADLGLNVEAFRSIMTVRLAFLLSYFRYYSVTCTQPQLLTSYLSNW